MTIKTWLITWSLHGFSPNKMIIKATTEEEANQKFMEKTNTGSGHRVDYMIEEVKEE